jgi:hypothetical protein
MSQSASPYPISQMINRVMEDHGYSTVEFVQSLGHRNIERGLRRLEAWLDRGEGYERILKQIAAAFPNQAEELKKAVTATKAVKAAGFEASWIRA